MEHENQDKTISEEVRLEDLDELDRISKASGISVARLLECALLEYFDGKSRERV